MVSTGILVPDLIGRREGSGAERDRRAVDGLA